MQRFHSQCACLAVCAGRCCHYMFSPSFWVPSLLLGPFLHFIMVSKYSSSSSGVIFVLTVGVGHINCHKVSLLTSVLCFIDAIHHYCGGNFTVSGPKATAGIFATYPAPYISIYTGFFDQVLQNEQCAKKLLDCTY